MSKTRIHDLAAEFGVESGELMRLLADMDIHVRSHLSGLDEGQVALVRARWEREKRKVSKPESEAPRTRRRRKAATEPEAPARPRRRRRTAEEVAAREAEEQAKREAEEAQEVGAADEPIEAAPAEEKPSFAERAAALFKDTVKEAEVEALDGAAAPVDDVESELQPTPPAESVDEPAPAAVRPKRVERWPPRRPGASSSPTPSASAAPGTTPAENAIAT